MKEADYYWHRTADNLIFIKYIRFGDLIIRRYGVDSEGVVYSFFRNRPPKPRRIKSRRCGYVHTVITFKIEELPILDSMGVYYSSVPMYDRKSGKYYPQFKKTITVHRLVMEAFHPRRTKPPAEISRYWSKLPAAVRRYINEQQRVINSNMTINHKTRRRNDNRACNLEWMTNLENIKEYHAGRAKEGEASMASNNELDVQEYKRPEYSLQEGEGVQENLYDHIRRATQLTLPGGDWDDPAYAPTEKLPVRR